MGFFCHTPSSEAAAAAATLPQMVDSLSALFMYPFFFQLFLKAKEMNNLFLPAAAATILRFYSLDTKKELTIQPLYQ